jgi:heme/copper-type cytochrome/quinol oxidase subunit 3
MFALYAILPRKAKIEIRDTLRTAAAAVWFAPLAIFLSEMSMWAWVMAGAAAASVTGLVRRYRDAMHGGSEPEALNAPAPGEVFHFLASQAPAPFPALCASAAAQAGGIAVLAGHPLAAAALVGISTAVVTWSSGATRGWEQHSEQQRSHTSQSMFRVMLTVALATAFAAGGLMRYVTVHRGFGWGSAQHSQNKLARTANSVLDALFGAPVPRLANLKPASEARNDSNAIVLGTVHPGVILWPEIRDRSILVPPLPAMGRGLFALRHANPLSVPFFGVYWLFKAPDKRPPEDSFRARGSPAAHTFFTTDHLPLYMEANQNFGTLIDLSCCGRIEIAISNADRYPGSVSLELLLINTTLPGRPSQSLGSIAVKSIPRWRPNDDDAPIPETLAFAVPSNTSLRKFDEAKIRFHLDALRAETAAKISIERFVFVPR